MNQILQNKPMSVFGEGEQTRAFSYIGDMAPIMAEAIENQEAYNQIFNIGADKPYTINQLVQAVANAMSVKPLVNHLPPRNEVQDAYSSHKKIETVFGKKVGHSLDQGLERMAKWVKQHGARQSNKFENVEITKNFPDAWKN
jgi:UDP-glucose 4-epimerase